MTDSDQASESVLTSETDDPFLTDPTALYFLPLGGSGEIGMNLNLYAFQRQWLMVDLGISFADETMPGLDVIMPDPAFIVARANRLAGLVLTHAHEDHLGAVQYLWPQLRCPVYCTPFTAAVLRAKLLEKGLKGEVPIIEVSPGGRVQIGPFEVEFIPVTHSIPEAQALAIRCGAGTVLHTGDWKIDPDPLLGPPVDSRRLREVGDEGVLALVGDSTNAMLPGSSGSEGEVAKALDQLIGEVGPVTVAVSCFATNVARLQSAARAAEQHGRTVALAGRSLWRINEAARASGYLKGVAPFIGEGEARYVPRDKLLLVCTGSQGEARSALSRIAGGDHPHISLERNDVVIFSSREIPGNERDIAKVQNALIGRGIKVLTADDAPVHVSGHPAREELVRMYQWVRPSIAIPVHGEARHMRAHAQVALDCQVGQALVPANGRLIRIAPDRHAEVVAELPHGRLAMDGKRLIPVSSAVVRNRTRILDNGQAVVTLVMNVRGELLAAPQLTAPGLLDPVEDHEDVLDVIDTVREAIAALPRDGRLDDERVRNTARLAIRRAFNVTHGKKPLTEIHLIRV